MVSRRKIFTSAAQFGAAALLPHPRLVHGDDGWIEVNDVQSQPPRLTPGEALRQLFGAWAEETEKELDHNLEWNRQQHGRNVRTENQDEPDR
jgi:hypothetical protein